MSSKRDLIIATVLIHVLRTLHVIHTMHMPPSHSYTSRHPAAPFSDGLLSSHVATEEPIKLALCSVLQHLCDCQVLHRVESTVAFAASFVESLQRNQRERHEKTFAKKPKEFRTSPQKQVKY